MKKPLAIFITITGIILFILLGIYYWQTSVLVKENEEPGSFIYTDFGIFVPNKYLHYGIDVSKYQHVINWEEVSRMKVQNISISFAFIKATEGTNLKDKRFKYNWVQSKENEIIRGAYHYFTPNTDPRKQANNFIQTVKLEAGDLPPVVDIEDRGRLSLSNFIENLISFFNILEEHYHCKPILYSYYSFHNSYLDQEPRLKKYPLWIARYGADKPDRYPWKFWQFSDRATVDGIGEKVDMNVFSGDSIQFQQLRLR